MLQTARHVQRHWSLLRTLTSRELKARYRGSVLGYFWSLVNPILLLAVYTFVFSVVFNPRDANTAPYGLFLVTGLFPWIWLQTSWLEGAGSLIANSGLIRKAAFPAELLPLVPVLANLVHFAFAVPVICVAFIGGRYLGHEAGGWTAVLIPLVTLCQLPMAAGLALGSAALQAHFKDVRDLLNNFLTLLFFMTPILYTLKTLDEFPLVQAIVRFNPVTPFTLAYQDLLFHGQIPGPFIWISMLIVSIVCWWGGSWIFERLSDTLVEAV